MITIALYTAFCIVANACCVKIMHVLIQEGQLLGGWQRVLQRMDRSDDKLLNALTKPLGYCEFCFSHLLSVIGFIVFITFMNSTDLWAFNIAASIVWYMVYVSCSTILSLYFLTQLFK